MPMKSRDTKKVAILFKNQTQTRILLGQPLQPNLPVPNQNALNIKTL